MNESQNLKGWKMLAYALFLGPLFLALYSRETRNAYPAARYFAWASLLAMGICAYLTFTFTFNPFVIRILYLITFLSIFGLAFFYCWGLHAKTKIRTPAPKQKYSFSRACAWMIVMGVLFAGLNNIVQAIYFWLLGEQVTVYFSSEANIFKFWILVGLIYGFVYGIGEKNDYFDRDLAALARAIFSVFVLISIYSGLTLSLVIYPLQRLAPISYSPQSAEVIFYVLLFVTMTLSSIYLLRKAARLGVLKTALMLFIGVPLIALHIIVVSAYSVTIDLAIASILEDKQEISAAKTLYGKAIPYIRYDNLLAALHHRQGVLQVLNGNYDSALESFKKVLADYSMNYEVFTKARRYVDAFDKNRLTKGWGRKILVVKHQTFEQAASCFPNSLAVILNFYEKKPISTRKLSLAIKEGFSEGTFIWKAESFLEKEGYELVTTFWQSKKTLISLLDAGYPILLYVPGHVYTLYGYDSRMEMFLTYDTAESNRWSDKPYWDLQREWMSGSFLMSVVIPKAERERLATLFPQFGRFDALYRLWQKSHISDYYEGRGDFWKDYDRYRLAKVFGLDRLKMNEPYFLHSELSAFTWDAEEWKREVLPVLSQPWALEWSLMENYILYLLYCGQSEEALQLVDLYQSHLPGDCSSAFPPLLELRLAALLDVGKEGDVLSVADKLIGITGNMGFWSYWGHYYKARHLMESGDLAGAAELLISALENLRLGSYPHLSSRSLTAIVGALNEICLTDSALIGSDKMPLIEVARIELVSDPGMDSESQVN